MERAEKSKAIKLKGEHRRYHERLSASPSGQGCPVETSHAITRECTQPFVENVPHEKTMLGFQKSLHKNKLLLIN